MKTIVSKDNGGFPEWGGDLQTFVINTLQVKGTRARKRAQKIAKRKKQNAYVVKLVNQAEREAAMCSLAAEVLCGIRRAYNSLVKRELERRAKEADQAKVEVAG